MAFANSTVLGEGSATYGSMIGPSDIPGPTTAAMRATLGVMGADDVRRAVIVGERSATYGSMNKHAEIIGPLDKTMQGVLGN